LDSPKIVLEGFKGKRGVFVPLFCFKALAGDFRAMTRPERGRRCNMGGEIGLDLQTVPGTNAIPQEHLPSKKLKAGSRITF